MKYKSCPAFKAVGDADAGTFEAIVSVFGNRDAYGDVVRPGAFADTLTEWKASGDPIPVLWSHRMDDPRFSIGTVIDAAELAPHDSRMPDWAGEWLKDHGGLWVKGQLDVGAEATDVATAARRLLKDRRVTQFSFAYDTLDAGWGEVEGEEVYELRRLKLYEVSPCVIGANDLTQLLGAKAAAMVSHVSELVDDTEMTRRLASKMDEAEVRSVMAFLATTLTARDDRDNVDSDKAKPEEPVGAKGEEPDRLDAESFRLLSDLTGMEMALQLTS